MRRAGLLLALMMLAACSFEPRYVRPAAPVPTAWPTGDAYAPENGTPPVLAYRQLFADPRLQRLIAQALVNNRDLRVAAANIEVARARYRVQRAELLPLVDATGGVTRRESGTGGATDTGTGIGGGGRTAYSAQVGTTAFEIDLFGRLRSLSRAALNDYFATDAAARATRLTLIGDIAIAWLTHAADQSLYTLAQQTAASAQRSVALTRARLEGGIAPRTDLLQAEQVLAQAQSDLAESRAALAQDVNALQLLVGAPIDPALLPDLVERVDGAIGDVPAGLSSAILLRRPDVMQAEYDLRAATARIGAARAALFPRISLTALAGFASGSLKSLFDGGTFTWSASPTASYDIFAGGAARAGVREAGAQRAAALASYERAIQSAFRETADALARKGTIEEQLAADTRLAVAARETERLTDARYRGGIDTYLSSLDAQRASYAAQRALVNTRLVRLANRVTLYRVLGGDPELAPGER
jgi:multidrug efflux system outer membrane protein